MPKADPYDDSGRLHKDIKLDILRAKYWLGVGAQPSDTMWRLMSMVSTIRNVGASRSCEQGPWRMGWDRSSNRHG